MTLYPLPLSRIAMDLARGLPEVTLAGAISGTSM